MTTSPVITGWLNMIISALTPVERWEAAREFQSTSIGEWWFILIGLIAMITLTLLFLVVRFNRIKVEQSVGKELFSEYAAGRGLSDRECQILRCIAHKTGLKQIESVFTLRAAFDRGSAKMMEESREEVNEEGAPLSTELSFLREKLGFRKDDVLSAESASKKLSSRKIPVGRKAHMTRRKARDSGDIESVVVKNTESEFAVKLSKPVKITFGEFWCVRCFFGASVWEFDTSVVSYDGNILVLNHSDNVRFINRRRFLRVPVGRSGFVARFPLMRTFGETRGSSEEGAKMGEDAGAVSAGVCRPPEFVPAVVTELAGPGLRIEAPLKIRVGERILVVFDLDQEQGQDSTAADGGNEGGGSRIVEDIGEVRRVEATPDGWSIAVELTGLSDSDIDELVRATNAASLSAGVGNRNNSTSVGEKQVTEEPASESAIVQGV